MSFRAETSPGLNRSLLTSLGSVFDHRLLECSESLLHLPLQSRHFLALFETVIHLVEHVLIRVERLCRSMVLAIGVETLESANSTHLKEIKVVLARIETLGRLSSGYNLIVHFSHPWERTLKPVNKLFLCVGLRFVKLRSSAEENRVSCREHGHCETVLKLNELFEGLSGHSCLLVLCLILIKLILYVFWLILLEVHPAADPVEGRARSLAQIIKGNSPSHGTLEVIFHVALEVGYE